MSTNVTLLSKKLSDAYKAACLAELEALKPGNVHIFADGHGMIVQDFIKSAEASCAVIAQDHLSVGERVYKAIEATNRAVGLNTNLGLVLLCAPLLHSYLNMSVNPSRSEFIPCFSKQLEHTLSMLSEEDGARVARAIVLANPAGLGNVSENDVHDLPKVTLLEMMRSAQHKDKIAWQYSNNFSDILVFGLTKYEQAIAKWQALTNNRRQNETWATTALYLSFLANQLDSHVLRKHGEALAKQLMQEALEIEALFWSADNPKLVQKHLLAWDASLKSRNINPGTSADLIVACLMVRNFEEIV